MFQATLFHIREIRGLFSSYPRLSASIRGSFSYDSFTHQNGLPLSDHSAAFGKVQTESLTQGHHSSYANKNPARHSANVNRP
jgi:hypothetical protein